MNIRIVKHKKSFSLAKPPNCYDMYGQNYSGDYNHYSEYGVCQGSCRNQVANGRIFSSKPFCLDSKNKKVHCDMPSCSRGDVPQNLFLPTKAKTNSVPDFSKCFISFGGKPANIDCEGKLIEGINFAFVTFNNTYRGNCKNGFFFYDKMCALEMEVCRNR